MKKGRVKKMGASASRIVHFDQVKKMDKKTPSKISENPYHKSWKELPPESIKDLNKLITMEEEEDRT